MAMEPEQEGYIINRSYVDSTRLNLQHYLWTSIFGFLLHPDIPCSSPDLAVADIGTGTGIWLFDISRLLPPTSKLDGFDIDGSQAPPREWTPSNIEFRDWDIRSEVPPDVVGQYDIVHIRLFTFVVPDPIPLLEKLIRLLKPGGWIQWAEPDIESVEIKKTDVSRSTQALENLFSHFGLKHARMQPTWVKHLPDVFIAAGLNQVKSQRCSGNDNQLFALHECNLLVYDLIMQRKGDSEDAKVVSGLVSAAAKESKDGAMYVFQRLNVIGRKGMA